MFSKSDTADMLDALDAAFAVIEFQPDGTILNANKNFLGAMGYQLGEIKGQHHRMFVDADYAASADYREFWRTLASGSSHQGEFRRVAKGGREIWIEATYSPIFDRDGNVDRVVKFAADVTAKRIQRFDFESQIEAINQSQCVIEFDVEGNILKANQNFLDFMGYSLDQIVGQHHRMFCPDDIANSAEYQAFWSDLANGEFKAGEFERRDSTGREIWLMASYNPVRDLAGNPIKVVKVANDCTEDAMQRKAREEVQDSLFSELDGVARAAQISSSSARTAVKQADEAASNVQAVAAGAEELAASFAEINRSVSEAMNISQQAVGEAQKTGDTMSQLTDAAQAIGQVVELIHSIADQTNLLALNATIEAARAGESGRGFAVVANEVKGLAGQTSRAIDSISGQIAAVQTSTKDAVSAIDTISGTISQIDQIATSIASSVEEQSAVTSDISANMQTAALSVEQVSSSVGEIDAQAGNVDRSAQVMTDAASKLSSSAA